MIQIITINTRESGACYNTGSTKERRVKSRSTQGGKRILGKTYRKAASETTLKGVKDFKRCSGEKEVKWKNLLDHGGQLK